MHNNKNTHMSQRYLTKQTQEKLKDEYNYLISEGRKEAAERIKAAIEDSGYEDNVQYEIERDKQAQLEQRIAEIEEVLRDSILIDCQNIDTTIVSIGALVTVDLDGDRDTFKIVGSYEADPLKNLISNESPVGIALIGSKVGSIIEVNTPVVKLRYKVLEIRYE